MAEENKAAAEQKLTRVVKILKLIRFCGECPHERHFEKPEHGRECREADNKLLTTRSIPDWCPLQTLPTGARNV